MCLFFEIQIQQNRIVGKNKLAKFAEMETFENVFQFSSKDIEEGKQLLLKGNWGKTVFGNDNPIVLELGCGKGEYTVGLAQLYPEKNFIGIDIKGARMWAGAKQALEQNLGNAAFLRMNIELIEQLFAANEVSEIWLTFSDPQMKKATKRLTSSYFMTRYQHIMRADGIIHLKTDSNFMYRYTCAMVEVNALEVLFSSDDLYHTLKDDKILGIKTYYEQQWIARGLNIKYLKFVLPAKSDLVEPDVEIEPDPYRSFGRSARTLISS